MGSADGKHYSTLSKDALAGFYKVVAKLQAYEFTLGAF